MLPLKLLLVTMLPIDNQDRTDRGNGIVLAENFYVDRRRCHKEAGNQILIVTRKKRRGQAFTFLVKSPLTEINENI